MPVALILLLALVAWVQTVLGAMLPSSWWTPDCCLAVMAIAISARPRQAGIAALVCGLSVGVGAARHSGLVTSGYVLSGWLMIWCANQWETTDRRIQALMVACLEGLLIIAWLFMDVLPNRLILGDWRSGLGWMGWICVRIAMTLLAWLILRRICARSFEREADAG